MDINFKLSKKYTICRIVRQGHLYEDDNKDGHHLLSLSLFFISLLKSATHSPIFSFYRMRFVHNV